MNSQTPQSLITFLWWQFSSSSKWHVTIVVHKLIDSLVCTRHLFLYKHKTSFLTPMSTMNGTASHETGLDDTQFPPPPPPPPEETTAPPPPPGTSGPPPPPEDDVPPPPPPPTTKKKKGWGSAPKRPAETPLSVEELLKKKREADAVASRVCILCAIPSYLFYSLQKNDANIFFFFFFFFSQNSYQKQNEKSSLWKSGIKKLKRIDWQSPTV